MQPYELGKREASGKERHTAIGVQEGGTKKHGQLHKYGTIVIYVLRGGFPCVPSALGEEFRPPGLAHVGTVLVLRVVLEVVRREAGVLRHPVERAGEVGKHFSGLHDQDLI